MEWGDEEATQESTRRGARQIRRFSPKRCQKAGQPREWPQGRPGQKPQEENCRPPKCWPLAAEEAPEQEIVSIRARFGYRDIGSGYGGIRSSAVHSAESELRMDSSNWVLWSTEESRACPDPTC